MEAPTTNGVNGHHAASDYDSSLEFDSIPSCITAFSQGQFLVVLDSPSRENEGDLIIAADAITPTQMAFMVRHTSGIICTPLSSTLCSPTHLDLPQMLPLTKNSDPNQTAYTISVDAQHPDVTTGISAADRALTCRALADPASSASSFRRPGHVFPLRARDGGVRVRMGHTEAAVEFCRLVGRREVGVISEIVCEGETVEGEAVLNGDVGMLRAKGCVEFARKWGLKVCTIEDLRSYVEETEGPWKG